MNHPHDEIPPARRGLHAIGLGLMVVGGLLFISVFFSAFSRQSPFGGVPHAPFATTTSGVTAFGPMARAPLGMVMMIVGGILMNVGRSGLAGSGVVLDPQQARRDVRPWSRMTGRMINDALEQVGVFQDLKPGAAPPPAEPIVKVRCRACGALNDEAAKFCNQCGTAV